MQNLLRVALGVVVGLLGLWWILVVFTLPTGTRPFAPLLNIVALLLSPFLTTLIHEVGHAIAGVLAGYRIRRIAVDPFLISFERGVRISLRSRTDLGGYVAALADGKGPAKLLALAARGPLANLAASLIIFLTVPLSNWSAPLSWGVGLYSLALGGYSLWPKTTDSHPSDGRVIGKALRALIVERGN